MKTQAMECVCCGAKTRNEIESWIEYCAGCGLWRAHLSGRLHEPQEDLCHVRDFGFRELRMRNFEAILDLLEGQTDLQSKSIVDIGCAQGWFIEAAQKRGMKSIGIEPEPAIAQLGRQGGLPIRNGFFPQALEPNEKFDAIVFNDVFEHLDDPVQMLKVCHQHLNQNGYLILNLPNSRGLFFRLACLLARFGVKGPLYRLWQVQFYTPHLFYFNPKNLSRLATANGFYKVAQKRLLTLSQSGLWARLNIPGAPIALWRKVFLFLILSVATPLINGILPPDTSVLIYQRRDRKLD